LVDEIVRKLRNIDVHRLSGGKFGKDVIVQEDSGTNPEQSEEHRTVAEKRKHDDETLSAARQRYLNRKAKRK